MDKTVFISDILERDIIKDSGIKAAIGCTIFVMLTALGAYVRIPLFFTPVPITLQTFFVLLSGALLGGRLGAVSQAAYVSLGAFGLPIFQGYGYGIAHVFGPTGGYLFGFIMASYAVGYLIKNHDSGKGMSKIFLAMIIGLAIIYLFGVIWLKLLLGVSIPSVLVLGLYPFMPGEVIKVIAASYIYNRLAGRRT